MNKKILKKSIYWGKYSDNSRFSRVYKTKKIMGMTLLIDFEKAFDSLEWDYLESVLKVYNFGEDFRTWFSVLYKNSNSCVINNVFFTEFFKIGRSCR